MKKLHVECTPDEQLLKSLGYVRENIEHHNDKGRVCNKLEKSEGLIGLIDEDPDSAQPKYISTLVPFSDKHNIKVYNDFGRKNKMVILCPKLEDWVINVCKTQKIDIGKFKLSNNPNQLHKSINTKLDRLDDLVKFLLKEKAPQLVHLKKLMSE